MNDLNEKTAPNRLPNAGTGVPLGVALVAVCPEVRELCLLVGFGLQRLAAWATRTAIEAEEHYECGLALQAYRSRWRWKVSDVERVRALPRSRLSEKRLALLEAAPRRGRPVVRVHQSLPNVLVERFRAIHALFDSTTLPLTRIKLLKQTRFWPWFAEALYRGFYLEMKMQRITAPSIEAEGRAADLLMISTASLRKLCGSIRRQRRMDPESCWPAISREQFRRWSLTGELPDRT